ncbi:MAG: PKD domain-containing protein, partial [Ginsengibacter sp.]
MRKSFLPVVYLFLLLFSIGESKQIKAQSCCPEFELQFPKFNCESPDCPHSATGQPGGSVTMCQYSTNKIQVTPGISPGFTYVWDVTGGTINGGVLTTLATPLSYIDVTWGNGTLGVIKVTIYNSDSSCFKVLTQQFCLTKSPKALFVKNTGNTVCRNQAITFTNTSLGVYTNWYWNFGDGNTQNGGMSVSYAYPTAGTYIVSLTVSNSKDTQSNCGCSNTYYDTITVDNSTGLQILTPDCQKMHCAGDSVTYCASITGCSSYNWTALGGTVIGSGSCIKVVWNLLSSSIINPTVSLTIPPACAGSCGNSTSFIEKVLYNGMPIQGNNIVCVNAASTYTLPTLPGVFYKWSITPAGGFTIINGTDVNTPAFGVIFTSPGNYVIKCDYIDSLQNCQGSSSISVSVRPPYSIVGPSTSCVSCSSTFSTVPPGSFNWSINTIGPVLATGGSITHAWTSGQVGTWTVTATQIGSAFCNSPQQALIVVAPKPLLFIYKSTNVACPGTVVKFWVSSTVPDMNISW